MSFIKENFIQPQNDISQSGRRIHYIDLVKGICIVLVVMTHSEITDLPGTQAVRMPLFFIISGLFFKDYGGIFQFVEKKINRLFVPFCFFALIGLIAEWCVRYRFDGAIDFTTMFKPFRQPEMYNVPLWFLICLFWVNILYCFISLHVSNIFLRGFIVAICGAVGYALSYFQIYLPLFISTAFTALPYFFFGYLLRKMPFLYKSKYDNLLALSGLIALAVCILYCHHYGTPFIDFRTNIANHQNWAFIFLLSCTLVVSLFLVCKKLRWLPVISYIGRYSIIVLCIHDLVITYGNLFVYAATRYTLGGYETFALSLLVSWLCIPLCRRFIPFFTAQKDLINFRRNTPAVASASAERL